MNTIFISHAGPDRHIAKKLHDDLRNVGNDVRLDLHELKLGDDIISFMNNSIQESQAIIIIYSRHTPHATWQNLEINAAVWNNISQDGGQVIVLKYGNVNLPPILGPRVYGILDDASYETTLKNLCTTIAQQNSATARMYEALKEDSENPFWRVRAEYFDEHIPAMLSQAFSPPDGAKIQILEQIKPCFLEGSRGTGKTMLLLSLRARYLHHRDTAKSLSDLFGCYVRLDRGAFCNAGLHDLDGAILASVDSRSRDMVTDLFSQELHMGVLESLFSEIAFCVAHQMLSVGPANETHLVNSIESMLPSSLREPSARNFGDLIDHFASMRSDLSEYIRRKFIYQEESLVPFTCFDLRMVVRVVASVRAAIPSLANSQMTILLDEYENLLPHQKVVVNALIKLGPPVLSVKISRKSGSEEVSGTTTGQELQETHDYNRISLIYSVDNDSDRTRYTELLRNIVRRLPLGDGEAPLELDTLLPSDSSDEVSHHDLLEKVLVLLKMDRNQFLSLTPQEQNTKLTYYRDAAIFRCVYGTPGRRTKKRYSGCGELALISSGVIRCFQEILGMAYHLQAGSSDGFGSRIISPRYQSEAVHTVSTHSLAMLSRNVECFGEQLKYFLLDLGDCLRQKLLHHTSEPESTSIAISDPELLRTAGYEPLRKIVDVGVKEGVFQLREGRPGMRPKHVEDPQPVEVNITRMLAPALEISARLRWKSFVRCTELLGLLDEGRRTASKREIIRRLLGGGETSNNLTFPFSEDSG